MKRLVDGKWRFPKVLAVFFMVAMTIACSDDDGEPEVVELTEQDAAEIMAASLSEEDGGLAADVDNLLDEVEEDCGFTKTESLSNDESGEERNYVVDYDYSMQVICDENDEFLQIDYEYTATREAELLRLDVSSSVESIWEFLRDGDNYTLNGDYDYSGSEAFKIRNESSFNSEISYSSSDLTVNDDGDFLAGSIVFSQAVTLDEDSWDYSGSLVITSQNFALLDVSEFEFLYEIDIKSGDITQIER